MSTPQIREINNCKIQASIVAIVSSPASPSFHAIIQCLTLDLPNVKQKKGDFGDEAIMSKACTQL